MMLIVNRKWLIALLLIILITCFSSVVMAASNALEVWRSQASQTRILAENDAPAAYTAAKRLQSTLPADAAPTDRVRLLNLLARIEAYLALTDSATSHALQALSLAKQHADKVGQAEADLHIALTAVYQGQLDTMNAAIIDSMTVLDSAARKDRPDILIEAMLRTSMMYRRMSLFDSSIDVAMQAMAIAQPSNNPVALAHAHRGVAIAFEQSNHLVEAREHYMQMREQARAAHMRRLEAEAVVGLGGVISHLGDMLGGERLLREGINIFREVGDPFSVNFSLYALAKNLNQQGHVAAGLPLLGEAIAVYGKYPNKIGLWWALNARSMSYQSLGRVSAASVDADRAYTLAKNIGFPLYLSESAKRLAAIAALRGDHKRAYVLATKADEITLKGISESAGKHILELAQRYETESKQQQIDELNLSNERKTAELRQHELWQHWLITLAVSSLIVLSVTAFFLLHLRRSNRLLQEVAAERERTDEALLQSERQFRTLVENTPDHIARYDKNCHRVYANPSMVADSGMSLEQLLNQTPMKIHGGESYIGYEKLLNNVLATAEPEQYELNSKMADGAGVVRLIRLTPEFSPEGEVVSVLAVGRDITEIDAYRKQIHNLAFFDPLTNLPNRALLSDRVSQTVADASWLGHQFGLMLLDLDRFKEINDTLGHSVGDQVLREAAERLQSCVRSDDTVARLGGDEFAALLPDVRNSNDLAAIACKMLGAFTNPFMVDGRELFITTSIGIALYPANSADVETLFRYADSAMYHAKQQGRNNFQFYSSDLTEKAAGRMSIESDLRKAQERNELELYYQPQVELTSGRIVGAEALLRWHHRDKGLITPDKFIPVAEDTGLIVGIGEWVLHSACQAAVAWNTQRKPQSETPLRIAINLSIRQFIRNDLVSTVQRILWETGCEPDWLKLEITESLLLEDSNEIASMLATFNRMGLAISIDDFGTGYSALSYLNRFPVSQIKIDRSFVRGIPTDHDKTELVKAMISIAQALELELVAEGVETQEQADCLLAKGCNLVQGYLFGKPMPKVVFEAFMLDDAAANKSVHDQPNTQNEHRFTKGEANV